jgi:hypothetical protein
MIHHGGKKQGGSDLPSLSHSTMMNHGVVSTHVISDNAYCKKRLGKDYNDGKNTASKYYI